MRKTGCLFLLLLLLSTHHLPAQSVFSVQQLSDDLRFYQSKLEQYHPDLYLYQPKEKIDGFFDSLLRSIDAPMGEAGFYRKVTLTSNLVRDGHTLILPSDSFVAEHNAKSRFLPLQIGLHKGQLYVKMNYTPSMMIEDGTIIDSINGIASAEIIAELLNRQVRDGNHLSYAYWILDTYFREYYSYVFGHPETYDIAYTKNSISQHLRLEALYKDSIYQYRKNNYPAVYAEDVRSKGIYLNYDSSRSTAVLVIKDFHSDILKSEYNQNFSQTIQSIFHFIDSLPPRNLVLDLRDNQGGDVENGVLLLSYLINRPFKVVQEYNRVKHGKYVRCGGPSPGFHQPNKIQFKGQMYVLINGGSFSNSVIVSACLKANTNAVFVGTESGGNPNVLAGYAKELELPNTKIRVEIPTKQFIMTSLMSNDGRGVIPTYEIDNTIDDILHQRDGQLEFVMRLIAQGGK